MFSFPFNLLVSIQIATNSGDGAFVLRAHTSNFFLVCFYPAALPAAAVYNHSGTVNRHLAFHGSLRQFRIASSVPLAHGRTTTLFYHRRWCSRFAGVLNASPPVSSRRHNSRTHVPSAPTFSSPPDAFLGRNTAHRVCRRHRRFLWLKRPLRHDQVVRGVTTVPATLWYNIVKGTTTDR